MRCTWFPRLLVSSALLLVVQTLIGSPVASAAVKDRIRTSVTNNTHSAIPHSIHPRAKLGMDMGPTPAETRLVGMSLRFSMTDAQQAALDQLLIDLQNPSSPRYHQWLTPTEYAAQFGLSSGDIAKVTAWLSSQGFTVTGVANGGTFVTFDGTVAQAQKAFSTSIHNVSVDGQNHFANITDASVPTALASVVGGITGLHNFRIKPRTRASIVKPHYTSSVSGNHYVAPGDINTIYNVTPLLTTYSGAGIGTGANCHSIGTPQPKCGDIAVMGQVDIALTDIAAFRAAAGLPANPPTIVTEGTDPGSPTCSTSSCFPNNGDLAESSLDVEWSGAMAPGATVLFVNGKDVLANSLTQAIDQNLAPIITMSYGNCEAAWGSTDLNNYNQLFKQANAQGQTILSSTGDAGATDCDSGTSAIEGLAVDFPASSPYVTGVGGTMFNEGTATGATTYWAANNGSTGGSAIGYIPEKAWNEDTAGSAFTGGGGGVSNFFTKPAWQVQTGAAGMTTLVKPDGSRDLPDISLDAASGHDQLLYCAQGSCTNGFRDSGGFLTVAGGTSFDSQIFGGMLALIEQKIGTRVGNANPVLYALGNSATYYNTTSTSVYHDITVGDIQNPCTAGTPDCPTGGLIGPVAGTGYDMATGWGTLNVTNLANAWNVVTPLGSGSIGSAVSATSLTSSATAVVATVTGSPVVTLTATVTGTSGTPTGTVQFLANNIALGSPVALVAGVATFSYQTGCSTLGQQVMSAAYSGDSLYAGSKGPALSAGEAGSSTGTGVTSNGSIVTHPLIVNVTTTTCPDFTITPSTATVSVALGGTIPTVTLTVAPTNGFTGTVTLTAFSTETTGYTPTLTISPATVSVAGASPATSTLTFSGIIANLQAPRLPGQRGSETMLASATAQSSGRWYVAGSGATIASLLLLTIPRKRRLGGLLLVVLSVALIGGASGCSSSSQNVATTSTNAYAGTYSVTVVATYTSSTNQVTKHSTTISYFIQ